MDKHSAPIAKKDPKILSIHGDDRIDNYFWMRLSDQQKEAENPDEQTGINIVIRSVEEPLRQIVENASSYC